MKKVHLLFLMLFVLFQGSELIAKKRKKRSKKKPSISLKVSTGLTFGLSLTSLLIPIKGEL